MQPVFPNNFSPVLTVCQQTMKNALFTVAVVTIVVYEQAVAALCYTCVIPIALSLTRITRVV
jgi:hypothetical protein